MCREFSCSACYRCSKSPKFYDITPGHFNSIFYGGRPLISLKSDKPKISKNEDLKILNFCFK